MKIIKAKQENGVFKPSEELPKGILTQFNGTEYVVYEDGDELPVPPPVDEVAQANAQATQARAEAFREEADPLFFKAQRGEIEQQVWLDKVTEIRERYPKLEITPEK